MKCEDVRFDGRPRGGEMMSLSLALVFTDQLTFTFQSRVVSVSVSFSIWIDTHLEFLELDEECCRCETKMFAKVYCLLFVSLFLHS